VLVAFFGGLALGARLFGPMADRVARPLRLFAWLEGGAGALALVSSPILRQLGESGALGEGARVWLGPALLLAPTLLLGGTLPALVRSATAEPARVAHTTGQLGGINTGGALLGVGAAAVLIPTVGLAGSLMGAGSLALGVAGVAAALAPRRAWAPDAADPREPGAIPFTAGPARAKPAHRSRVQALLLVASAWAGAATLAFEVLAARAAALRLGSSLLSWALVLAGMLGGLALGNLLAARRAAGGPRPEADLGWIEAGAALAVLLGLQGILPGPGAGGAGGPTAIAIARILAAVGLPAALMGAAFPLLVRVALRETVAIGGGLGRLVGANTAGGIAGALAASFLLLPRLGPAGAAAACAGANALLALLFLTRDRARARDLRAEDPARPAARARRGAWRQVVVGSGAAVSILALGTLWAALASRGSARGMGGDVLFVGHGAEATAVVVHRGSRRDLIVDGEAQASTAGAARRTEELLAVLPILLHPAPERLFEVGLGSGITLGTAVRFDLAAIECVEIAPPVLEAARFFVPDNGGVTLRRDPRVRIWLGDGRLWLARRQDTYDLVLANTVHPWSVGATGLYSREYFARMARALREGGLAAQWLPVDRIDGESFAAIVATFFTVFPHGGLWWGDESVLLIGAREPLGAFDPARGAARLRAAGLAPERLGLRAVEALLERRLARAETVRAALRDVPLLRDDRPWLELRALRRGARKGRTSPLATLIDLARREGAAESLVLWLRARRAAREGDDEAAGRWTGLADAAGLALAREARLDARSRAAREAFEAGRDERATRLYREVLERAPAHPSAAFGLAALLAQERRTEPARRVLETLLRTHPEHAEGWNLLGILARQAGDRAAARTAFRNALEADPFLRAALANAGLLALEQGDHARAQGLLGRLRAARPLSHAPGDEEATLARAIAEAVGHPLPDLPIRAR
jgi:spermidine synthase